MASVRITDEERTAKRAERQRIRDAEARHVDQRDNGSAIARDKARDILIWNRRREREISEEIGEPVDTPR